MGTDYSLEGPTRHIALDSNHCFVKSKMSVYLIEILALYVLARFVLIYSTE